MKTAKCPCCGQRSNLRKVECGMCGAYSMSSRSEIANGLHPCRCGHGQLEPVCLADRARCFPDTDYGREAGAEYAYRFPVLVDPVYSARAKKGSVTKARRKEWAAVRNGAAPVMPF